MSIATYLERRGQLQTYFDRTAVDAWAPLTSDASVGRIRATVRAGRDEMRATLLSWLPSNLNGARLLDASCALTAFFALGTLAGFGLAARALGRDADPYRIAGFGAVAGVFAFSAVIFAAPLHSVLLFRIGTALIGFGGGLFAAGTLTAAMMLARDGECGLALGTWGAVQATAAGGGIAVGGGIRDAVTSLAANGMLGRALADPSAGYSVVYHIEVALLFATLVAIGPLVRSARRSFSQSPTKFGLAEFPG